MLKTLIQWWQRFWGRTPEDLHRKRLQAAQRVIIKFGDTFLDELQDHQGPALKAIDDALKHAGLPYRYKPYLSYRIFRVAGNAWRDGPDPRVRKGAFMTWRDLIMDVPNWEKMDALTPQERDALEVAFWYFARWCSSTGVKIAVAVYLQHATLYLPELRKVQPDVTRGQLIRLHQFSLVNYPGWFFDAFMQEEIVKDLLGG